MTEVNYLESLNPLQYESVCSTEGPNLIIAGAGTGKTKVLTTRVAHIIDNNLAFPSQILCVTFTNKAAREMSERVQKLVSQNMEKMPWMGTFHSIGAKIIRNHAEVIGLKQSFTILDKDDQLSLIKQIIKAENLDQSQFSPKLIQSKIDHWKNKALNPNDIKSESLDNLVDEKSLSIYKIYQARLFEINCLDFGDLLLQCINLFKVPDIHKRYSNNFKYIHVDEYQDTNAAQYKWLKLLGSHHQNVCCVGDDDQSIYSWRGAEIKNFLEFDKIYENTKIVRLEKNYRSTQNILTTASELIKNNENRLGKDLYTNTEDGELIKLDCYRNGKDEAIGVGDKIEKYRKKNSLNNISILVRAIFQTREFEERFLKIGLPYRIIGGIKFYERAEIKDCIAYLRVVFQPNNDLSLERIINNPKRSIGESSIKQINEFAKKNGTTMESACKKLIEKNLIKPKTKVNLNIFLNMLQKWRNDYSRKIGHVKLLQLILDESGYSQMLKDKKDLENENRLENIKELISAMKEFDNLESFLDHVSLATSIDQDWEGEKVNLMTMHSSKGLEFDIIFLPGWEEGLFPHQKSIEEKGQKGLEEERRLAYVGITRARKIVNISFSMNRFYQGDWIDSMESRFVGELPENILEKNTSFNDGNEEDFEFNQDVEFESEIKSPGWIRYQKRIK